MCSLKTIKEPSAQWKLAGLARSVFNPWLPWHIYASFKREKWDIGIIIVADVQIWFCELFYSVFTSLFEQSWFPEELE